MNQEKLISKKEGRKKRQDRTGVVDLWRLLSCLFARWAFTFSVFSLQLFFFDLFLCDVKRHSLIFMFLRLSLLSSFVFVFVFFAFYSPLNPPHSALPLPLFPAFCMGLVSLGNRHESIIRKERMLSKTDKERRLFVPLLLFFLSLLLESTRTHIPLHAPLTPPPWYGVRTEKTDREITEWSKKMRRYQRIRE